MSNWDRLEMMARSEDFNGGLEARIADPLWMLSRQWQAAEFEGEDAAQPAAARLTARHYTLSQVGVSGVGVVPLPAGKPLEALVESSPAPDFGAAGLHAAARASRRLLHLLTLAGLTQAYGLLRVAFPLQSPERLVLAGPSASQAAGLFTRQALDASALARAGTPAVMAVLQGALASGDAVRVYEILSTWSAWFLQHDGQAGSPAWNDEQLEYQFSVSTGPAPVSKTGSAVLAGLTLTAGGYTGTHLDWHSFDMAAGAPDSTTARDKTYSSIPAPVRYKGMPASRWWEFEDGSVNFGDLDAGPTDLFRLLIAEFATAYSNDWFIIPMRVPIGTLTEITNFVLLDNFGGRQVIRSAAANDLAGSGPRRVWRLFELTGDEIGPGHPSPWLLAAPALVNSTGGPALERVTLVRDEAANLAWGIETLVEGVLGRAVDRAQAWHTAQPAAEPPSRPPADGEAWHYHVEKPVPAWWIPFLPERIEKNSPQTRFRRARMETWQTFSDPAAARQVGPQGLFLDPRRPVYINEEEIPVSGVRLQRSWQFGRWTDGSYFVWLQRTKEIGRGERSSGLRWDKLDPDA